MGRITMATAVVLLSAVTACGGNNNGSTSGSTGSGSGSFTQDDVVAAFQHFTTTGFTKISKMGVPSQHMLAKLVVIWVSDAEAAAYRAIDPAAKGATAGPFPVGTIVIKQHLDQNQQPLGSATVLAKMAAGFNPSAADWWWGRFDTNGSLAESGVIGYCIQCHEANHLQPTDYLHGVFSDNK